jgi:hypothetical protein
MLKKTIKHKDLDGNDVETDAYFNLTKAEAVELNIRNDLEVIGRNRNNNEIMDAFRRVMSMSYGVKTSDGKFIKVNPQGAPLFNEFSTGEAYSELFMELFTDSGKALEFIKGILPAEIASEQFGAPAGSAPSQAEVPSHLAGHPSMQGYRQATPSPRPAPEATITPAQPSAADQDTEYQEWLKNRGISAPPGEVSTPEAPQPSETGARVPDELT